MEPSSRAGTAKYFVQMEGMAGPGRRPESRGLG